MATGSFELRISQTEFLQIRWCTRMQPHKSGGNKKKLQKGPLEGQECTRKQSKQ